MKEMIDFCINIIINFNLAAVMRKKGINLKNKPLNNLKIIMQTATTLGNWVIH